MNLPAQSLSPVCHPLNELVLLDDDQLTIEIVSWIVRKTSYTSRLFTDAEEALVYLKLNMPKLLVVDYYMPCMTGLEFLSELNASADFSQSAVFLCSAVPPPESAAEKFAAMNVAMLEKQLICDKKQLGLLLQEHLEPADGA